MAAKDTFEAFVDIVQDKIDEFSASSDQPNMKIIQDELKDKFDDLIKSQGYVPSAEYRTLENLAKKLEARIVKLESLVKESKSK